MAFSLPYGWRNANHDGKLTDRQKTILTLVAADAMIRDSLDVSTSPLLRNLARFLPLTSKKVVQERTRLLTVTNDWERSQLRQVAVVAPTEQVTGVMARGYISPPHIT